MDHVPSPAADDAIDIAELLRRLRRSILLVVGFSLVGFGLGIVISLYSANKQAAVSTLRVSLGFPGVERGVYPNGSKFQPDDIRAPDVVNEAIKRLGLAIPPDHSSRIRGAIGIIGFVSPNIVKERDRRRANGEDLPPYFPDEYEISLSLPRNYMLGVRQRELLLGEIINVYLEKFRRTYVALPMEFGNAIGALQNADFVEYELILTQEMQSLIAYLDQKIETGGADHGDRPDAMDAIKQFRSPTNNLSFQDLRKLSELFMQIRLNDVLSHIYAHGLSKDRPRAMLKLDYHLRTLQDQERRLKEEETVISNLLNRTQERAQNYVLATKAQSPQGGQPMLDQGFIDTLLANDAYNFLIRRALDAGLAVKRIQSDQSRLQERRQRMESFVKSDASGQAAAIASTQQSLLALETDYTKLLSEVRVVLDDYARQEYADAVRISMQASTKSLRSSLLMGAVIGAATGIALGLGLALIRAHPRANS